MKNIPVNISSKCFFLNSFSQSCDYQKILKFLIEIQPEHVHNLILKMLASVPERRITSSDVVKLLAEYRTQVKTQRENLFF
jgi:hypothetical protein